MSFGDDIRNGVPIGLPSILSLGLPPLVNPYPALNLDFINNPLDPRITFTRATTATYFNSSGVLSTAASGEARFDYNPTTLAAQGLLIEEQRTNNFPHSEDFGNANWTKTNSSVTTNQITSPDGTLTADELKDTSDVSATAHLVSPSPFSFSSGVAYTIAAFAKQGTLPGVSIVFPSAAFTSNLTARFNVQTGVVASADAGITASIINVGNGWYRCIATVTATATASVQIQIRTATSTTSFYQGDGTGTIFIWGAQLEAGNFATSYIPTTTTALTRNADAASMTGTDFSSWYNAVEGTIYIEALSNANSSSDGSSLAISDGTNNNRFQFGTGGGNTVWNPFVIVSGSGVATLTQSASFGPKTNPKLVLAYAVNNFAASVSGQAPVTDTSGALPTVNQMLFGATGSGGVSLNSTIRRIAYYPTRLANTQLQALTL